MRLFQLICYTAFILVSYSGICQDTAYATQQDKIKDLENSYKVSKAAQKNDLIAKNGLKLASSYFQVDSLKVKAKETLIELVEIGKQRSDSLMIGKAFQKLAINSLVEGNYIETITSCNNATRYAPAIKDTNFLMMTALYKGYAYNELKDFDNARKEFFSILNYSQNDSSRIVKSAYINIGSTFKNPDSILYYSKKVTDFCLSDPEDIDLNCYVAYNNIANAHLTLKNPQKAIEILNTHLDLERSKAISNETEIYLAIAHSFGLANYQLEKYDAAIRYFKKALNTEFTRNKVTYLITVKRDLSKAYEKMGNYEEALKISRDVDSLETIFNEINLKTEIAKIEARRTLENAELHIESLEQENVNFKEQVGKVTFLVYVVSLIAILTFLSLLLLRLKNKYILSKKNKEMSVSRVVSLRNAMNPHFLFNSFSTLQNLILKNQNLKANEFMTSLSELIRSILDNSESLYIEFNKEVMLIQSYVEIEQIRFDEKFKFTLEIANDLIEQNPLIPSMMIQPFMENSIIHGFAGLERKGLLSVNFYRIEDLVVCEVCDNGIGREKAELIKGQKHLSIATANVKKRLHLLNQTSNGKGEIRINDIKDNFGGGAGTQVTISLPIKPKK